ncbi:MAG TPA: TolC family protein [Opitutus sp.]|nr:TolC family protein [Opitutus sp.]
MNLSPSLSLALLAAVTLLAGCRTAVPAYETRARDDLAAIRPTAPALDSQLPAVDSSSPPADFIRFAVLHHPAVIAAYDDWRAAVAAVTPARSLPDPKFTFQADIADTLMSFMPGLMFDVMTTGKRTAMGREAAAGAEVAHRAYVAAVLRTAAEARRAWIELAYVEQSRRLYTRTIHAAEETLDFTNSGYATGRGMASFTEQTRLQNEIARHHAHHAALDERLVAARARFKSALGLAPADADPPWPVPELTATALPTADQLWQRAAAGNPELAQMRAMVDMAIASVAVAEKTGTPDFSVGAMVDLRANPLMVRPTAAVSLPIWRDRIAAAVASATARRDAATARVRAEELELAAELAQQLSMVRESDLMLAYIDHTALPNLTRTVASLEAGVASGMGDPAMIAETRMSELDLQHERLDALRDRENAVVDLLLLTAAVTPVDLNPASNSR